MYESMLNFPASALADIERLRRDFEHLFQPAGQAASIRSVAAGSFPPINVGHTPRSVEVYAFAPGLDASKVEVTLDRGVLTLSGERLPTTPAADASAHPRASVYSRERPSGSFRRAVSLPEDIDPGKVEARYRDGVLHVSIARREAAQPRRISVQ
jgi:HSP20 family protein